MAWTIEYTPKSKKQLEKLDRTIARRIEDYLEQHVAALPDPRLAGKALRGALNHRWRYRVGDYLVVCDIVDAKVVILVIEIDHRSRVYR